MSELPARLAVAVDPVRHAGAVAALAYISRAWHQVRQEPEVARISRSHVQTALLNLQATYAIRAFAEVEAIPIDHLIVRHPQVRLPRSAEALINRVAQRERIPDPIRTAVQAVREYHNSLVHQQIAPVPTQSLPQVMAALNRCLVRLP